MVIDGGEFIYYIIKLFSGMLVLFKMDVKDMMVVGDFFIGGFLYFLFIKVKSVDDFDVWVENFENVSEVMEFVICCGVYMVM